MSEIQPGVHRIDTRLGDRLSTVWLVTGSQRGLLFDTGVDTAIPEYVLPYLDEYGISTDSVKHAVVSHADVDHFGGVADAHEGLPAVRVAAHRADARLIEDYPSFEVERVRGFRDPWGVDESDSGVEWCRSVARVDRLDDRLSGDEVLDLGSRDVRIRHLPGHSHGHLGLHDRSTDTWMISDAVLGDAVPLADGAAAFAPTYRFVDDYLATIDLLERARPGRLATAHYGVFEGDDALQFLQISRDFVSEMDSTVTGVLADVGPTTLSDLLPIVNQAVARWPLDGTEASLAFPLVGHLEQLIDLGRVVRSADGAGPATISLVRA